VLRAAALGLRGSDDGTTLILDLVFKAFVLQQQGGRALAVLV
jgi:hypothetical protein